MTDYRAGRLLVSVIPDMRGGAERIRREFSGLGPYTVPIDVKVDDKALAGLRTALRSLPDVILTANSSAADREVHALRERIMALSDAQIGVDLSAADAKREVDSIRADLARLANESPEIGVRVDAAAAESALHGVSDELGRLNGRTANVKVTADTGRANTALAATDAYARRLDGRSIVMNVLADVGRAVGSLVMAGAAANLLVNRDYRMNITADTSAAVAGIARVVALISLLSGGIGIVSGLAGALGGLGAAGAVAGAGVGAAVLGFLGVGKALTAMSAQQENAATTSRQSAQQQVQHAAQVQSAQERLRQASTAAFRAREDAARDYGRAAADVDKAREDGARSVQRAEEQAARAISSARDQVVAASRRLEAANRSARMAQTELTRSWEEGRRALEDLQDQVDGNALDQRQAAFDLADARKTLAAAQASGDGDQIARAQLGLDKQLETMDQLAKRSRRASSDNASAQAAGVAGSQQVVAALERQRSANEAATDAGIALANANANVRQAEIDGARTVQDARRSANEQIAASEQRLRDVQESGRRSIEAADQQVIESQRALTQALQQTGDAGQSAADKVASAFAQLSPEAAAFARYLFGLKPVLDGLSATAAAGLFPPLTQGIEALLTQLPLINTVVGQLAAGMGLALKGVLVELASPFWAQFFALLGNSASTVIPLLFSTLMAVARAAAVLITCLLPLAPAGAEIVTMLADLLGYLSPFLAALMGGTIPAARAFLQALYPLGPVLAALAPILNVLGVAFSQILGAVLQALTPILVALTPLIEAFAQSMAAGLVGALSAATPFLVAFATWLSANPGLVLGVVGVLGTLLGFLRPLAFVLGLVATFAIRAMVIGALGSVFTALGLQGSFLARALMAVLQPFSAIKLAFAGLSSMAGAAGGWMALLRNAIMMVGRAILTALGPIGILFVVLGLLYTQSEPFRNAINGLLAVLMGLVGQIVSAVMPIFTVLGDVVSMLAGVFGALVQQLAVALVPVINLVAGVLGQLINAVLPPLVSIIQSLLPVITMLGQIFVQLIAGALAPLISLFGQLVAAILPPLVSIIQSVVVPVIQFLAGVLAGVLVFAINYLVIPALKLITWVLTNVIIPAFSFLGTFIGWVWSTLLRPVFEALVWFWQNVIAPAATWLWVNVIQPVFQAIGAFINWVWTYLIRPAFLLLVWMIQNVLMPVITWLWQNVVRPIFQALGAFIGWVWTYLIKPAFDALVWVIQNIITPAVMWLWNNVIRPAFQGIGAVITWVWENVIRPAFDAVMGGLDWLGKSFESATNWIRDVWNRIRGYLAKPINFLIDVVWNKGILTAWNAVAGLVGIPPIAPLGLIPEAATGGYLGKSADAAGGGLLRGPGTPTSDSILGVDAYGMATARVSRDEFVVNAAITRKTLPFLSALNAGQGEALQAAGGLQRVAPKMFHGRSGFDQNVARAVPGRRDGGLAGVPALAAGGGPFQSRIDEAKRWLSGPARGAPYVYGGGTNPRVGMDCSSMQSAVTHILSGRPPDSGRIGTTATMPWSGFVGGLSSDYAIGNKPADHMAGTLQGQNVEQHGPNGNPFTFPSRWGADNGYFTQAYSLPIVGGQFVSGGEGGGGGNWILDKARAVFDEFTNPAIDAIKGFVGEPPPEWRKVPPALATMIRDKLRDWVFGKAAEQGGTTNVDISNISGPVYDQVHEVAKRMGFGEGPEWEAIKWIITHENRGWDPNAKNPDSNARGLFQKMTSVHGPIEPTPAGQAAWGIQYMVDRYGSPTAAKRFWEANRHYAGGGLVTPFDRGGIMRGQGWALKATPGDERVLDPIQNGEYDTLSEYRRMIEDGTLSTSASLSDRDIARMTSDPGAAAFPERFELTAEAFRIDGDGLISIIGGELVATGDLVTDGRID